MRYYLVAIVAAFVVVACQSTWPLWPAIGDCKPNLAIALVVCVGMLRGPIAGAWIGLLTALLVSSLEAPPAGYTLSGAPMGGLMVSHIGVGVGAGIVRANLLADSPFVAGLITLGAVPISNFVELLFTPPPSLVSWVLLTVCQAPYTAVLAIPLYLLLQPLLREPPAPLMPIRTRP